VSSPPPEARPAGTVLVVEDDTSLRAAMARILRLSGYAPLMFASGEELLESGDGLQPACVILDVQLPGIDGFELHDRLLSRSGAFPVVFITAFEEPNTRARVREGPGRAYLPKPFSGHALIDAVHRVVRGT
jgi:FixJ family two-component response regulator